MMKLIYYNIIQIIILNQYFCFTSPGWNKFERSRIQPHRDIYAIEVHGGEEKAKSIAEELNLLYLRRIGSLENWFLIGDQHFSKKSRQKKSKIKNALPLLESHQDVSFVQEQNIYKKRVKRALFSDPEYSKQWYLESSKDSECQFDLNVAKVWATNITGKQVTICVLDDGIEYSHPDLKNNYDPLASYDYVEDISDPRPAQNDAHGTKCAGVAAAEGNNGYCGVGVAYEANIGGIRMISERSRDSTEASSLTHKWDHIDIYSNSWGPSDNGRTMDGPGLITEKAIEEGAKKGRRGLGSIYVWAGGNGGHYDYCSCDGFVNMPETITIGPVDNCGKIPYYAESCPGVLAVAYSSGAYEKFDKKITSTDLNGRCTSNFSGTSAAAPLAAGVFALVLQANRNITWRDLQYLVVKSSRKVNPTDPSWVRNGAGYYSSVYYGFGVLDAKAIVDMASDPTWESASERHTCKSKTFETPVEINYGVELIRKYETDGCKTSLSTYVQSLEHVILLITLTSKPRGGIRIRLQSPSGTISELLKPRSKDNDYSIISWKFMSVSFWGENPTGKWTVKVLQTKSMRQAGYLNSWQLILHGTCDNNTIVPSRNDTTIQEHDDRNETKKNIIRVAIYATVGGMSAATFVSVVVLYSIWRSNKKRGSIQGNTVVTFSNEGFDQ